MLTLDTLDDLCREIKISATKGGANTDRALWTMWELGHAKNYRVTLMYRKKSMSCDFFLDPDCSDSLVTADNVMRHLLQQAEYGAMEFEVFASRTGCNMLDHKAFLRWRRARGLAYKLRLMLRDDFDKFFSAKR